LITKNETFDREISTKGKLLENLEWKNKDYITRMRQEYKRLQNKINFELNRKQMEYEDMASRTRDLFMEVTELRVKVSKILKYYPDS
jgi:deoxyadenosine/deoxycytidine kinase